MGKRPEEGIFPSFFFFRNPTDPFSTASSELKIYIMRVLDVYIFSVCSAEMCRGGFK
jgi:hypothetical protein